MIDFVSPMGDITMEDFVFPQVIPFDLVEFPEAYKLPFPDSDVVILMFDWDYELAFLEIARRDCFRVMGALGS